MTPAETLGAFTAALAYEDLPQDVIRSVKERVLDTLGVMLAGAASPPARSLEGLFPEASGATTALAVTRTERLFLPHAAFLSGTLAHSIEFDDTHLPSIIHPSAFLVPAALTAAQVAKSSGREVITALAAGYEAIVRLAMVAYDREMGNSVFFERGLHGASICGALGAAVVASKLLGADAPKALHAVAVAASFGAGILEPNRRGGTVKQIQAGWATHAGVWAALLARAGITGPPTVLEGRFGFYQALLGREFDVAGQLSDLGRAWETPKIFFKPYPTNHFTHTAIDAAIAIRQEAGRPLGAGDVVRGELRVATSTVRTIGEPRDQKAHPADAYQARFSGPFLVAMALRGGSGLGLGLDDFTSEVVADPDLLAVARQIEVVGDFACDAVFPRHFPAVLRLELTDGRTVEKAVWQNRGGEERPLTGKDVRAKFLANAGRQVDGDSARQLAALVDELSDLPDVGALVAAWGRGMRRAS